MIAATLAALLSLAAEPATCLQSADGWERFVERAVAEHGEFGGRCAKFLAEQRPARDASLDADLLLENLRLALAAREEFPWAKSVPEELFLNDVLPYAVFDETRESWRPQFVAIGRELVKGCTTGGEAAQALNRSLFQRINVHYNTGRRRPNQSPKESIAQGRATCTGLAIVLVDACRAVGVPARAAGTPLWSDKRGNHTWAEVWDGAWKFTGADEYDAGGLDRGWFAADAARARADDWRNAIWATSFQKTGERFPMVWNLDAYDVAGVNVTARYASATTPAKTDLATVSLRVFDKEGGERLVTDVELLDDGGTVLGRVTTKAGRADLNDMPSFAVAPGRDYRLRFFHGDEQRSRALRVDEPGTTPRAFTVELVWERLDPGSLALRLVDEWLHLLPEERHLSIPSIALTRDEAAEITRRLIDERFKQIRTDRAGELTDDALTLGDRKLRLLRRTFGEPGAHGRSLWISMHGGGGAPAGVNDQQWQNQIRLYQPGEGLYLAPRAPTDTWNLWHEAPIDDLFDRLIEDLVVFEGVDPDRVYLLGYSAGGDGVYQLAPRMADRFAAASMMAGHPNDAQPLGLRNLPFRIFMGGDDDAYQRNAVAARWRDWLAELQSADPDGYPHEVTIYPGLGHWMDGRDREALPWMAARTRDPWPRRVVWYQSSRTHERFYWLAVDPESARGGQRVRADVDGQTVRIETTGVQSLTLRLSDALLDLDRPVKVVRVERSSDGVVREIPLFDGAVPRSVAAIDHSLARRADPRSVATAELRLQW